MLLEAGASADKPDRYGYSVHEDIYLIMGQMSPFSAAQSIMNATCNTSTIRKRPYIVDEAVKELEIPAKCKSYLLSH